MIRYFVVDVRIAELNYIFITQVNITVPCTPSCNQSITLPPISPYPTNFSTNCVFAIFTTIFDGNSAAFFYVNVTGTLSKTTSNTLTINVLTPAAFLTKIGFDVIIADIDGLAINSVVFVETAVTYNSRGIQKSFFNPTVLFPYNYISGLTSFSILNNTQYNFSINNLNFTTFPDSVYNDVSHFNLWVR